jgi:hypothetical protein
VLWDTQDGSELGAPLQVANGQVQAISFSPDSRLFAASTETATLWDVRARKRLGNPFPIEQGSVPVARFAPSGDLVVANVADTAQWPGMCALGSGSRAKSPAATSPEPSGATFSPTVPTGMSARSSGRLSLHSARGDCVLELVRRHRAHRADRRGHARRDRGRRLRGALVRGRRAAGSPTGWPGRKKQTRIELERLQRNGLVTTNCDRQLLAKREVVELALAAWRASREQAANVTRTTTAPRAGTRVVTAPIGDVSSAKRLLNLAVRTDEFRPPPSNGSSRQIRF